MLCLYFQKKKERKAKNCTVSNLVAGGREISLKNFWACKNTHFVLKYRPFLSIYYLTIYYRPKSVLHTELSSLNFSKLPSSREFKLLIIPFTCAVKVQ